MLVDLHTIIVDLLPSRFYHVRVPVSGEMEISAQALLNIAEWVEQNRPYLEEDAKGKRIRIENEEEFRQAYKEYFKQNEIPVEREEWLNLTYTFGAHIFLDTNFWDFMLHMPPSWYPTTDNERHRKQGTKKEEKTA